jgi:hypothetical protein
MLANGKWDLTRGLKGDISLSFWVSQNKALYIILDFYIDIIPVTACV